MSFRSTPYSKRNFLYLLLVRFWAVYFFIFIFPFPANYLSFLSLPVKYYVRFFDAFISWTGKFFFHLSFALASTHNGSGDTTYNYVQLFLFVVIAAVISIGWSIADRNKKIQGTILYWLFIYVRFYFACTMMRYGLDKIIKAQFPFPYVNLTEMYGESSPLKLMWSFMGYSTVYNLFIGGGEIVAGFLVLFRRTTLLGALLSIVILLNIVVLNFCFDVPVKLFALNLLLMAVFIAAPDGKRLAGFFFFNRTVATPPILPRFDERKANAMWIVIKIVLTLCVLHSIFGIVRYRYIYSGDGAFAKTPLFGIYQTESFVRNQDTLPPLLTDTAQWKTLNIIYINKATIRMMNDSAKICRFSTDTIHKKIELSYNNDSTYKATLNYSIPDSNHLVISGKLKGDSVYIVMKKKDMNQYLLINRGFHWINESPYYR